MCDRQSWQVVVEKVGRQAGLTFPHRRTTASISLSMDSTPTSRSRAAPGMLFPFCTRGTVLRRWRTKSATHWMKGWRTCREAGNKKLHIGLLAHPLAPERFLTKSIFFFSSALRMCHSMLQWAHSIFLCLNTLHLLDQAFKIQDYFIISSEKPKQDWTLTTSQYTITHILYFKTQRTVTKNTKVT